MKLFNEEIKNDFMDQHSNINRNNVVNLFERITPKEEKLNKDLYDFSVTEIIDFYKGTGVASVDILYNMNNLFRRYTAWALAKQMVKDGQNHYDELNDYNLYMQMVNPIKLDSQFITREELLDDCKYMPNPVNAFVALGLYEGIGSDREEKTNEFFGLSMSDFRNGKVFLHSGRTLEVSKELISYAKEAADTYDICPFDSEAGFWKNGEVALRVHYDEDDHNIIKQTNNARNENIDAYRKVRILVAQLKMAFNKDVYMPRALIRSGLIAYINKLAEGRTDFNNVIAENYEAISYRYGEIPNITKFISKYRKYLEMCK